MKINLAIPFEDIKPLIEKSLSEPSYDCPMCGAGEFGVFDGYIIEALKPALVEKPAIIQTRKKPKTKEAQVFVKAAVVCNGCHYLMYFAVAHLMGGDPPSDGHE